MGIFKDLWGGMRNVADISSHIHTLGALLGFLKGHDPATEAPAKVKGWVGFLGYGDERQWLILLEKLEQKVPGGSIIISQFKMWHFRTSRNWASSLYVKWRENQFRSVIIDMGDSQGTDIGDIDQTITTKDGPSTEVITKIKKKLRSEGVNNGLDLLVRMHSIIQAEVVSGRPQIRGFKKCLAYLKSAGVPIIDHKVDDKIDEVTTTVTEKAIGAAPEVVRQLREGGRHTAEQVHNAAVQLHNYRLDQESKMTRWQKFIDWL